jgi:hypothetical protein
MAMLSVGRVVRDDDYLLLMYGFLEVQVFKQCDDR